MQMWELYTNQAAFNKLHYGQVGSIIAVSDTNTAMMAMMLWHDGYVSK